jgi:hypothetical protein
MRLLTFLLLVTGPLSAADLSGVVVADHDRSPVAREVCPFRLRPATDG